MIITTDEGRNAWVGEFALLDAHIRRFFRDATGEIWAYGTDLKVLASDEDFARFYLGTATALGSVGRVKSIKLVVPANGYSALDNSSYNSATVDMNKLRANLGKYSVDAPPVWVANLDKVGSQGDTACAHKSPWVLCVEGGHLSHENAIAIRLFEKPFPARVSITLPASLVGPELETHFNTVFTNELNFKKLVCGPDAAEASSLLLRQNAWLPPDLTPFIRKRVLVIIALHEEMAVTRKILGLREVPNLGYWQTEIMAQNVIGENVRYNLLVRGLPEMGNTDAALHTMKGIEEFDPDVVVSLGIAGGIGLKVGTVVVATTVHAYEYATVVSAGRFMRKGAWQYNRETRMKTCKDAEKLHPGIVRALEEWNKKENVAKIHSQEKIASGSKKSKCVAFTRDIAGRDKKICAIEMEAEGVGWAADMMGKPFLVVKGISDTADESTIDDPNRKNAIRAAAKFLRFMLDNGCL
jgi:nucleoside phosphorylase